MVDNSCLAMSYFNKINDINIKINDLEEGKYKLVLSEVLNNMQNIFDNYSNFLNDCFDDDFRYVDYFSYDLDKNEIIYYFNKNYDGNDYEERLPQFIMFSLFKYLGEIFDLYEEIDFLELCYLVDANNYFEKLSYLSSNLINVLEGSKWNSINHDDELPFLNNKYKIFFTGLSLDDVEKLEAKVRMQLINKLTYPLSTEVVVPKSEAIDHVKDLYKFPIQRIQFANDYRIAFVRYENVTAILGVTIKTGKDINYKRYDSIGRKKDLLYKEIDKFREDNLLPLADHYRVVELLDKTYKKKSSKGKGNI